MDSLKKKHLRQPGERKVSFNPPEVKHSDIYKLSFTLFFFLSFLQQHILKVLTRILFEVSSYTILLQAIFPVA